MPDMETPEADAAEQERPVNHPDSDPDSAVGTPPGDAPLEVDEGDLAESNREVPLDDDDWR